MIIDFFNIVLWISNHSVFLDRLLSLGTGLPIDKDIAQCCLVGPDGRIDEISVPFHCALK